MARRRVASGVWDVLDQLAHQGAQREACELEEAAYALLDVEPVDQAAASELAGLICQRSKRAVGFWRSHLPARETPQTDRLNRIAQAALDGTPVVPVAPRRVELFARLHEMQTMPIGEAFALLAERAPKLREIERRLPPFPTDEQTQVRWRGELLNDLRPLVGHDAKTGDLLLTTNAMFGLASSYLQIAAGDASLGTTASGYSEILRARRKRLLDDGWTLEKRPGGRTLVSKRTRFAAALPSAPNASQPEAAD